MSGEAQALRDALREVLAREVDELLARFLAVAGGAELDLLEAVDVARDVFCDAAEKMANYWWEGVNER